jgi:hypothetical protein
LKLALAWNLLQYGQKGNGDGEMFRDAYEMASKFTFPVAISRRTWGNNCFSNIGTFILLNNDGWILTAGHILQLILRLDSETTAAKALEAQIEAIENDSAMDAVQKRSAKKRLGKPDAGSTNRYSVLWGNTGQAVASSISLISEIDIGVAKLENFPAIDAGSLPKLKDPKDYRIASGLCRLGYPFHSISPSWDAANQKFDLPPGSWPPPSFPIEGIFTRVTMPPAAAAAPPSSFPLKWIETSSPGLKGQSGGPIFDAAGDVWGVQCVTQHLTMGFDPVVPGNTHTVHQFLNVGQGVHMETVIGFLSQLGVQFQVSKA